VTTPSPLAVAAEARQIPRSRAGRRRERGFALRVVLAVLAAAVLLFPLYWMVVVAFSPRDELFSRELALWPSTLTLDNFTRLFETFPVVTWLGNSAVITVFVTALTVILNLMAGYAFARLRFHGRNVILLLALSTLMLPVQVIMVSQFDLVTRLGLYGTYWAVILPSAATAFGIFLARQFIIGIPQEIIEAARVDGAGHVRVFVEIVLPLCKPLIAVLTLLTAMSTWNDFAWPLIALKENHLFTLPIGLLFLRGQYSPDFNGIMALALLATLPMVILFLVFQRYFVQGFARTGIR
jgi:ABC-type glycerol-3-phosphate transport system permease component